MVPLHCRRTFVDSFVHNHTTGWVYSIHSLCKIMKWCVSTKGHHGFNVLSYFVILLFHSQNNNSYAHSNRMEI